MTEQDIRSLLKSYRSGPGADDVVGPQLKAGGKAVQSALIRLLDRDGVSPEDASTIFEVLAVYFPVEDSYVAMERHASRQSDPGDREAGRRIIESLRRAASGH